METISKNLGYLPKFEAKIVNRERVRDFNNFCKSQNFHFYFDNFSLLFNIFNNAKVGRRKILVKRENKIGK